MSVLNDGISFSIGLMMIVGITVAEPDPNNHIYLLFGQSNMAGGCKEPAQGDCDTTSRVKVLAYADCQNRVSGACGNLTLNRKMNSWYTAFPPYHGCGEGIGIGDSFVKTLLDSIREDIKIGIIPCAFSGQSMKIFKKGERTQIPQWCNSTLSQMGSVSVYDWMVERCKIAQKTGVIKGILVHQGETDNTASWWVNTTKEIFDNLKKDLKLKADLPILVGELLQEPNKDGNLKPCCSAHNTRVRELAAAYDHCEFISSDGLEMRNDDTAWKAHFSCAAFKKFGMRYAQKLLSMSDNNYIPRLGAVATQKKKLHAIKDFSLWEKGAVIYSLDGKEVASVKNAAELSHLKTTLTGNVYLVAEPGNRNSAAQVISLVKYGR